MSDEIEMLLIAAGTALAAGALGTGVLYAVRRRSVAVQAVTVALTGMAAVVVGVLVAARAMFISPHDLDVLLTVTAAAGLVGVVAAVILGHRVAGASRSLGEATRRIGTGREVGATPVAAVELTRLGRELDAMAARLAEAQSREQAVEASRRELVAWVSHDLRTPLAAIRAMAEALDDGVVSGPADVARYHRTILAEADRLAGLVDDLFELSRIHAGALHLRLAHASLDDLVSDALAAADPLARAKGVRLEGRRGGTAPAVEVSAPELLRVLRNLLHNAIRHTPSDGTVVVEVGAGSTHAYVAVADACGGIAEADLARVFDVAFRGEPARTPAPDGGAGLGLAIARGIVEAHSGDLTVANAGDGCRFVVRLPLPA